VRPTDREFQREFHHLDHCRDCASQIVMHTPRRLSLCCKCTERRFRFAGIRVNPDPRGLTPTG